MATSNDLLSLGFATNRQLFETFISEKQIAFDAPSSTYGSSDPLTSGTFAVFITTPDLNLNATTDKYLSTNNPFVNGAVLNCFKNKANFIKLFFNAAKSAPFQDINLDTNETGENWDGAKLTIAKSTINSRQSGTVSIQMAEYADAPVTNALNYWINYIDGVTKGHIVPTQSNVDNRILDYVCSIYVFAMKADYTTITHAAKYTGCFPTSVPASAGSGEVGKAEVTTVDATFAFTRYEFNTAGILEDFNRSAGGGSSESSLQYASMIGGRNEFKGGRAYLTINASKPVISSTQSTSSSITA